MKRDKKLEAYLSEMISRLALTSGYMISFAPFDRLDEMQVRVNKNRKFWNKARHYLDKLERKK